MAEPQRIGISHELAKEAGISVESLDRARVCSDNDLKTYARTCDVWELIAYTIGLSEPQINAVKEENNSTEVRRIKFLLNGRKATLKQLTGCWLTHF